MRSLQVKYHVLLFNLLLIIDVEICLYRLSAVYNNIKKMIIIIIIIFLIVIVIIIHAHISFLLLVFVTLVSSSEPKVVRELRWRAGERDLGVHELFAPSVCAAHQSDAETKWWHKIFGLYELGVHLDWMVVMGVKGYI